MWEVITDHILRAKNRLLEQYKGKKRVEDLLEAFVKEYQSLEDVLNVLSVKRSLEEAEGVQLDGIGQIVGRSRIPGQTDEQYLLDIKTQIIQNLNQGTVDEFISAALFFTGASDIWYQEVYPASVDVMLSESVDPSMVAFIRARLESFLPATVTLDVFGFMPEPTFLFNLPPGLGDDTDPSVGGLLSEIYD